jgi:glycosyltransferase involved in cell wall biosynthesis
VTGRSSFSGRSELAITRIAFVSTYPPRQCGIAAFTGELGRVTPDREIVALHPAEPIPPYAFEVHHRIRRDERSDYPRTARSLEHCADVVSIQWDPSIWGGDDGDSVLDFVRALKLPAVATLHTLPRNPTPRQREILVELLDSVASTVVLSHAAATLLTKVYDVDPYRVEVIPYGIPDLPIMSAETIKASVALDGRVVLLSFGLLDPGKGYERVIDALPAIVAEHPNATYVIVGATHPDVIRREGETYRTALKARAEALGMAGHIRFVGEFVGRVELTRWLQAADVFVTPNPDLGTMASGPLTYAMAAGRAIVSTRYPYAAELLADGRGLLVGSGPSAIAAGVLRLLGNDKLRMTMGARAHEHSRSMAWTRVGAAYQALFARVAGAAPPADRTASREEARLYVAGLPPK